jgi:hypothetical protein
MADPLRVWYPYDRPAPGEWIDGFPPDRGKAKPLIALGIFPCAAAARARIEARYL